MPRARSTGLVYRLFSLPCPSPSQSVPGPFSSDPDLDRVEDMRRSVFSWGQVNRDFRSLENVVTASPLLYTQGQDRGSPWEFVERRGGTRNVRVEEVPDPT